MYGSYVWHAAGMPEMTVSEDRADLADAIDRVRRAMSPCTLRRRGKRVAALVDPDDLDRLVELAEDPGSR
jgi:prevent-host-death family protein